MKIQRILSRLALGAVALIMLNACNLPQEQTAPGGTRAWIDVPRDRSVLSLIPHEVIAHASDADGLSQVELIVNGASIGALTCEDLTLPLVTCRGMWNPIAPGDYRLEAQATNPGGSVGTSPPVYVSIGEGSPPTVTTPASPEIISVTPEWTPSDTISPPTEIIAPTLTWTAPPVCPGQPDIRSFTASPDSITVGESATLSWDEVTNATLVEIDHGIGEVSTPGSRGVSPETTTTYTLTATGCGGTVTQPVTITVNPLPTEKPTQPPTQKPPAAPSNVRQVSRSCTDPDEIAIAWNDNSNNESGFRIYHRARNPDTIWALVATVDANVTQYTDAHSFSRFKKIEYAIEAYNEGGKSKRAVVSIGECIE